MVVSPAQRIGRIRKIWQAAAGGLGKGQGDVYTSPVFQHNVGQIVRGKRILWLDSQGLFVKSLGFLPISLGLEKGSEGEVDRDIRRGSNQGPAIVCDGLIDLTLRGLNSGEQDERR